MTGYSKKKKKKIKTVLRLVNKTSECSIILFALAVKVKHIFILKIISIFTILIRFDIFYT